MDLSVYLRGWVRTPLLSICYLITYCGTLRYSLQKHRDQRESTEYAHNMTFLIKVGKTKRHSHTLLMVSFRSLLFPSFAFSCLYFPDAFLLSILMFSFYLCLYSQCFPSNSLILYDFFLTHLTLSVPLQLHTTAKYSKQQKNDNLVTFYFSSLLLQWMQVKEKRVFCIP